MLRYHDTPVQEIHDTVLEKAGVRLLIKREDLNHPYVSGNKWWKLKYNLEEAKNLGKKTLLTFGGAYSNHIYATAAAAKELGFESIGIIRGEEMHPLNSTLSFAKSCGMLLHYMSREQFRRKNEPELINELHQQFGDFYSIPEGGSNELAVTGIKEFAETLRRIDFNHLCVPVGTGGTLAGLIASFPGLQSITGFSVLKGGEFLTNDVKNFLPEFSEHASANWRIDTSCHFGGYGKITKDLLNFTIGFEERYGFRLDPIYTGKMMMGIFAGINRQVFHKGTIILAIHTGGVQGWNGVNNLLGTIK